MNVVIVESPAKAKTINKYLGNDYKVIASFGHIRDLPSKDGSVRPDQDFEMIYEISERSKKHIKSISDAAKTADKIYLATDPDREGEAISWHIAEVLKGAKAIKKGTIIKRIAFNEITKDAILNAIKESRDIDMDLVNAQQARRALDYLVGFTLSPVLWRKLPGSKSAGRVQSVALRLVCDREEEIEKFISREYWDIKGDFLTENQDNFTASLSHINGKKLEKFDLNKKDDAERVAKELSTKTYQIKDIEKKQIRRNAPAPFTTSSLQQEASKKLGFSPDYTMQLAQKLYEGVSLSGDTVGLITYMRTDGVQVSQDAINATRALIQELFGDKYLPKSPKIYKTKTRNAQEAHEAIRPTNIHNTPDKVKPYLEMPLFALYELIWKRMVACQMENAVLDSVAILINSSDNFATFRASGSILSFDGFYKLYRESIEKDTSNNDEDDENRILPPVEIGHILSLTTVIPAQHFTEPPPRFSEASLIKKMEELGIGRPSTYAPIISLLQERSYVKFEKKRFIPEERGRLVTTFLISFFKKYIEYNFTARMEEELDEVSAGELNWKILLRNFWDDFDNNIKEVKDRPMTEILDAINDALEYHLFPKTENGKDSRACPICNQGKLSLKLGKFGAFIACSNYPECKHTSKISDGDENIEDNEVIIQDEHKNLGRDPISGLEVSLRKGPYGFYVQLGEKGEDKNQKPKRSTIPSNLQLSEVNLDKALVLLSLPREIGAHPETGEIISANFGRFGPYLLYQGKYTNLAPEDDLLTIGINRAVTLIADKAATSGKTSAKPLKILGNHPNDKAEIALYNGRYGPYIKYGKNNVPIKNKKNLSIENITLDAALEIIAEYQNQKEAKS